MVMLHPRCLVGTATQYQIQQFYTQDGEEQNRFDGGGLVTSDPGTDWWWCHTDKARSALEQQQADCNITEILNKIIFYAIAQ